MKNNLKIALVCFLAVSLNFLGLAQAAPALITTQEVATASADQDRSLVVSTLQRQDLQDKFIQLGVNPADVEQRVAALSDEEVSRLADQIRSAPAGGVSVLGFLLVIFIVLLITDILGYTKVFPFVKPMKHN